jgi:hypothetical protein
MLLALSVARTARLPYAAPSRMIEPVIETVHGVAAVASPAAAVPWVLAPREA